MSSQIITSKTRQIINILLGVLFFSFAIIQLNDPDPMTWFSLYMIIAIVSITSNYKNINKLIIWTLFIGYLIYAGIHFPYFIDWLQTENKEELFGAMVYEKPYLEGTREFIGVMMAAGALFFQVKNNTY